ncbi:hypothetical protein [Actinoplanes sp. NPDC089786]|uniref:hypothetical protein n=1 Tax=Actinoplanes sp. NPDC089786 TaxID=3155185 RepID=UPI0034495C7D
MSYVLEAVVGREPALRSLAAGHSPAVVVPLAFDLALIPITREVAASLAEAYAGGLPSRRPDLDRLPDAVKAELARRSADGPIGYLEAEFFGGTGTQWAALWSGGSMVIGPLSVAEDERFPADGSPISRVLAALGVERGGHYDEFDAPTCSATGTPTTGRQTPDRRRAAAGAWTRVG